MKSSLFTRIIASGMVATLVLSTVLFILPAPRAHARLLEIKDRDKAQFSNVSFGQASNLDQKKSEITFGEPVIVDLYNGENNITINPNAPPTISNLFADNITDVSARLNATATGGAQSTNIQVQIQDDISKEVKQSNPFNIGAGNNQQLVSIPVSGLVPLRKYNFLFAAQNQDGTVTSQPASFTTLNGGGGGGQQVPTVQTGPATNLRLETIRVENQDKVVTAATLNGSVDPKGLSGILAGFRARQLGETIWIESQLVPLQATNGPVSGTGIFYAHEFSRTYEFYCIAKRDGQVVAQGATLTFTSLSQPGPTVQAPGVVTLPAELTNTFVKFNGTVNPNGASTSYWFEYGQNGDFGLSTAQTTIAGTAGTTTVSVTVQAQPGTWNFRLAAQNQAGVTRGTMLWITVPETGGGGGQTTITLIKAFWWSDTGMLKVEALAPQDSQLRIVELGDFGFMQFKSGRFIKKTSIGTKPDSVTIKAKDGSQITVHVTAK